MNTLFIKPTSQQRLQVLKDYSEPCDRLVREKERQYITSVSRSTAWKLERSGLFPQRKSLGTKSCAWLLSDLLYWINER